MSWCTMQGKRMDTISTASADLDSLLKEPDVAATELHVVNFFNTHFSELEDLEKLDSVLNDLRKNEQNLNEKVKHLMKIQRIRKF